MGEGDKVRLTAPGEDGTWTIRTDSGVDEHRFEEELKGLSKKGILSYRRDEHGTFLVRSHVGPFALAITMTR